jgi:predicted MFS family arabinose efflux permease
MSTQQLNSPDRIIEATPRRADRWHLPAGVAFYLQASIVIFFLAGSSAPTPLYSVYQSEWGFSPITTTVVFGIYALAVLAALLVVGSLSDHIGRRPVLLVALVVQAAVMVLFAYADGVPELMLARVIQGLATGSAVGAIGAGMLDIDRAKGTVANSVAPLVGTATGGVLSGFLVQYLPIPTHLVYLVLAAIFVVQAVGVALMAETASTHPGAIASLRPQFGVPSHLRRPVFAAIPALLAIWALAGFYGSLGPSLVRIVAGSSSFVVAGAALSVLAGSGALAVLVLHGTEGRRMMAIGVVSLFIGVGLTLVAVAETSSVIFFAGTTVAGVGFGAAFQGAIRTVIPLAAPHQRSGLLSIMYVVSYLGMGLPAVVAGVLVVHNGGVLTTAREYGAAVMVLAALALLGLARRPARVEPVAVQVPCG